MNKREAVETFRERLGEVIARSGMSRSKFAQSVGLERSTLTQLLSERTVRLPRLETLAAIAAGQQVSLDWLLGLRQEDDIATGILPNMEIAEGAAGPADERLSQWQREAAGYKIRYVPTSLPDLLKTDDVISYEFALDTEVTPSARMADAADKLAYSRKPETDIESCSSIQSVVSFVKGEGTWRGLDVEVRRTQVERMIELVDELYPTFRWFMFDALSVYSSPYTVFGPLRAVTYIGGMYFVFNSTEHIRVLSKHFDNLIRMAEVQPPDCAKFLSGMLQDCR